MASSKSRYSAPVLPLTCFTSSSLSPNRLRYSSVNFDITRSVSPTRNLQPHSPVRSVPAKGGQRKPVPSASGRQMCLCSPTNHPVAFRCRLHRNSPPSPSSSSSSSSSTNYQLHMRRSAMKNSLVRIVSVEGGEWVNKALIRPSSHQVRRRSTSFQPQPSRLRHMTMAEDSTVS